MKIMPVIPTINNNNRTQSKQAFGANLTEASKTLITKQFGDENLGIVEKAIANIASHGKNHPNIEIIHSKAAVSGNPRYLLTATTDVNPDEIAQLILKSDQLKDFIHGIQDVAEELVKTLNNKRL